MPRAAVRILHPQPGEDAGELTRLLERARSLAADDLAGRFREAGAEDVRIEAGPPDGRTFGERLRVLGAELDPGDGLVVVGSGSIVLAADDHLRRLLDVAASGERRALTNNAYSSDVLAIGDAAILAAAPDLRSDNLLPRWLGGAADVPISELPHRDRLALDLDSPLDLELLRRHPACPPALAALARTMRHRLERVAAVFDELAALGRDPKAELLVAGRLSSATLRHLEEGTACRIRAIVEERGLRTAIAGQRPVVSTIGLLLDRDGPDEIGNVVARYADGGVIDSRVVLAHRLGADEAGWPSAEDRYASDLLLPDRIRDAWLRQLTLHAWAHDVPIALGAHSLVGPGLSLALGLDA